MAFKNLEQQFREKMDELYSPREHPAKDSDDLHPLIESRPNDPDRAQGIAESNRLYPVPHVVTDEQRMTKWLTSPTGLRWLLSQEVLQTGNAISETRLINPLFVNLNLTPTEHFKRHLFDQQSFALDDPARSPASTPQVGWAGRLQIETSNRSIANLLNRPSFGSTLASVLGATQLATQLASPIRSVNGATMGVEGTLGVNQRPELDVTQGKDYYTLQYEGVETIFDNQMALVADALGFVGSALATVGLPNLFSGLRTPASSPIRRAGGDDAKRVRSWMPYYASVGKTYLNNGYTPDTSAKVVPLALQGLKFVKVPDKVLEVAESAMREISKLIDTIPVNKITSTLSNLGINTPTLDAVEISKKAMATVKAGDSNALTLEDQLSDVAKERSVKRYFEKAEPSQQIDKSLPPSAQDAERRNINLKQRIKQELQTEKDSDPRIQRLKAKREAQQDAMQQWNDLRRRLIESGEAPGRRGIVGGISINETTATTEGGSIDAAPIASIIDTTTKDAFFANKTRYYTDLINFPSEQNWSIITGEPGGERAQPSDNFLDDYVKFRILDFSNNRLLIFRAIIDTITETHTPEFVETKYLGRVERNIVYSGNVRTVLVTFYVHAFSESELPVVWQKMNYLSGLTFPARYNQSGYVIPPLVEFTIGDMYVNQPGYISAYDVTVENETSWEIREGRQVPLTLMINATFTLIEKEQIASKTGRVYSYPKD